MNIISRTISALVFLLIGFFLSIYSLRMQVVSWILLFYSIVLIVIGIFILFNKKEDKIEEIKISKTKKGGKNE